MLRTVLLTHLSESRATGNLARELGWDSTRRLLRKGIFNSRLRAKYISFLRIASHHRSFGNAVSNARLGLECRYRQFSSQRLEQRVCHLSLQDFFECVCGNTVNAVGWEPRSFSILSCVNVPCLALGSGQGNDLSSSQIAGTQSLFSFSEPQ